MSLRRHDRPRTARPSLAARAGALAPAGLCLALGTLACSAASADTVRERLDRRGFPSIFQAWSPVEGTGEGELDAVARHDLYWRTLAAYGLAWDEGTNVVSTDARGRSFDGGYGRATAFAPDGVRAARSRRAALLARNPDMVLLTELRYRDGPPGFLADDADPWWLRDASGSRVLGWPEGGSYRLDFRDAEFRAHVVERARTIMATGAVDGLMLDVWNENEGEGFGTARIDLIREVRAAIGEEAILVVNTNESIAPRSAPHVNGLFLETFSPRTAEAWARYRGTMEWAGANLRSPAFTALETWRELAGANDVSRRDPDDLRQMRATTALSLVASDGFALFADPNSLPLSDHLHDWYDLWDVELGRPAGPAVDLVGGAVRRDYDDGVAVYSPPGGTTGTIDFDRPVTRASRPNAPAATSHDIEPFDGELFLYAGDAPSPPGDAGASIDGFSPPPNVTAGARATVAVPYDTEAPADLVVSFQDTADAWKTYGFARTSVPAGTDEIEVAVDVSPDAPAGESYAWTAWLVPPGGTWPDRLAVASVDGVTVGGPVEDDLAGLDAPRTLVPGARFEVEVAYAAAAGRTIHVSLQDTARDWTTEAYARVSVPAGAGTATVSLEVDAGARPGARYTLGAYLTAPGDEWDGRLDAVRANGIRVRR